MCVCVCVSIDRCVICIGACWCRCPTLLTRATSQSSSLLLRTPCLPPAAAAATTVTVAVPQLLAIIISIIFIIPWPATRVAASPCPRQIPTCLYPYPSLSWAVSPTYFPVALDSHRVPCMPSFPGLLWAWPLRLGLVTYLFRMTSFVMLVVDMK